MPVTNPAVKDYQRRLAELTLAYCRALIRLQAATAKRAEVVGQHDLRVRSAERVVEHAVNDTVTVFGAEAAAHLLGLSGGQVSAAVRSVRRSGGDDEAAASLNNGARSLR